jgi:hypothetical protein
MPQDESGLLEEAIFLCRVAAPTRRNNVVPRMRSATTLWHHVVNVLGLRPAILTAMTVTSENRPSRDRDARLSRDFHELNEAHDGRLREDGSLRMECAPCLVNELCFLVQDEHEGSSGRRHTNGLIRCIEDQRAAWHLSARNPASNAPPSRCAQTSPRRLARPNGHLVEPTL